MKRAAGILIFAGVVTCSPAWAATVVSIQPSAIPAAAGSVGDEFDIVLTNSGPGSIAVGSFNFEISVADPDITLTGADFSTVAFPYIFAGHSLDADFLAPLNFTSGATLDANDTYDVVAAGVTLASGDSLSLGRVLFNVSAAAATGPFAVSFTGSPTIADSNNLSDPTGTIMAIDTFTNGTINITSTPEPSSIFLTLAGIAALASLARRRRA